MPLATFPTLPGLGWDIKKRPIFSNAKEVAASGAEFSTAYWSQPMYEFDFDVNFLSQSHRDQLEAFYLAHLGDHLPFLLTVTNDNYKAGLAMSPAPNGSNTVFQLLGLPAQTNVVGHQLRVNGAPVAGTVSETGMVTFAVAPAGGSTPTCDTTYCYVVKFKDKMEFNQMMSVMYEVRKITFRTYR